jgi:formylglycine-generating enzyme required for sulfatase activity
MKATLTAIILAALLSAPAWAGEGFVDIGAQSCVSGTSQTSSWDVTVLATGLAWPKGLTTPRFPAGAGPMGIDLCDPEPDWTREGLVERLVVNLNRVAVGNLGPFVDWHPRPYEGMVAIPAGSFEMGRHVGSGNADELPVHTVRLDAFHMDVYEVTNEKYAAYLNAAHQQGRVMVWGPSGVVYPVGGAGEALCDTTTGSSSSRITWNGSVFGVTPGKEDHPMVRVSWYGACAYANQCSRNDWLTPCYNEANWSCNFNANGYRLPTEAEWEYAARGGQHNPYTMYPWGDTIDGSKANYSSSGDPYETGPYPWTTPVGYYDGNQTPAGVDMANGYGLYDMSGNVWEWCWDRYQADYYSWSPTNNPTGPGTGLWRVFRGGGWMPPPPSCLRSAHRYHDGYIPPGRDHGIGFRVVAACR